MAIVAHGRPSRCVLFCRSDVGSSHGLEKLRLQQKFEASLSAVQKDKQFQVESLERQLAEANLHLGSNSAELTKQMHAERERYQEELSRVESRFRAELAASRSELAFESRHECLAMC